MVGCIVLALAPLQRQAAAVAASAATAAAPPSCSNGSGDDEGFGAAACWPEVELNSMLMGAALDVLVSVYLGVDLGSEAGFEPRRLGAEASEAAEVVQQFVDKPWKAAYTWVPWLNAVSACAVAGTARSPSHDCTYCTPKCHTGCTCCHVWRDRPAGMWQMCSTCTHA
jgi:hypothetical protein